MSEWIKNKREILSKISDEKERKYVKLLLDTAEEAINFAQPSSFLNRNIKFEENSLICKKEKFVFDKNANFYLISFGKAAQTMTNWFITNAPYSFNQILISSPDEPSDKIKNIPNCHFFMGGHPIPNDESIKVAKKTIKILSKLKEQDVCIFLISGGGSSLFELPIIKMYSYVKLMKLLLSSGATIHEINTVRKHFSQIKGGKIVNYTSANIYSFIISDVPGNDPTNIASGPTVMDTTTWEDCERIIRKYKIEKKLPIEVKEILQNRHKQRNYETPKDREKFHKVNNVLIGSNQVVLNHLRENILKQNKIDGEIISYNIEGKAAKIGKWIAKKYVKKYPQERVFLWGGETTVELPKNTENIGKGGRNQELALSFALKLGKNKKAYLIEFGTDGIDGNSEAAGAIVGPFTISNRLRKKEAKRSLKKHDTNGFFHKVHGEIITGYTGTNVMDVGVLIVTRD
ncbi:MAG: glycerate kinase type-2 family protein [Candidatus Heimdallarchaeaceae archaeon]